jgi:hypothetical protein
MTIESAEDTIDCADVRIIRIRIDDERHSGFRIFAIPDFICHVCETEKACLLKQGERIFPGDPFAP